MQIILIILWKRLFTRIIKLITCIAPAYKQYSYHNISISCKWFLFTSFQKVQTGCKSSSSHPANQVFMRLYDNSFLSCRGIRIVLLSSFITSMSRDYRITLCIYSNLTTIYFNIPIFSLLFYNSIGITYFFLAPHNNIRLIKI